MADEALLADKAPRSAAPLVSKWRLGIMQSGLPATTRHVLLTLSCFMSNSAGHCYPTTRQIAQATGLSERAVCTHIARAAQAGWLRVSMRNGRTWKRHEYHADWPGRGTERGSVTPGTEGPVKDPTNTQKPSPRTERSSVRSEGRLHPRLQSEDPKALNEVQQQSGNESSAQPHDALNDVQCLTEPNDTNSLNEVQCNYPYNYPITSQENRASEIGADNTHTHGSKGLMREERASGQASMLLPIVGGKGASKADAAEAARHRRVAAQINRLPKHERAAAWLAAMGER
ncbi:helix-turn-helix domain-containing protein [Aliihoeflea sp. 2WW]|uniref:helix-turn-helix domain-containing protein n=1 Tax=Aliihoeflea sp. 2WW TaxID=1381123 RepID=UPI0013778662|nr:helix-turn-helix domain-containing protein [Aliihoeflea sp. 2WW]